MSTRTISIVEKVREELGVPAGNAFEQVYCLHCYLATPAWRERCLHCRKLIEKHLVLLAPPKPQSQLACAA